MSTGHPGGHRDWCAADHRCNLNEHRAAEIVVDVPGAGRIVLTRVRDRAGCEHAEIRMRVVLPVDEAHSRTRLVSLLTHLQTLLGPARRAVGIAAVRRIPGGGIGSC